MYTHHTHTNVYWLRLFMLTWQSREYREEHNYVRFCACLAITVWIFCVELRCANRNECDVRARMFTCWTLLYWGCCCCALSRKKKKSLPPI